MIVDINAQVDLGSKEVTHPIEEPKFSVKNTLPFNGVLSNWRSIKSKGWPTTNGDAIILDSFENKVATFSYRNKKYVIDGIEKILADKIKIELPVDDEIKQYYIDAENNIIYILTDKRIFKYDFNEYKEIFTIEENKSCFFTTDNNGIIWYDNKFIDIKTNEILTETKFDFSNMEEPNNGYYEGYAYWIVGHDSMDHSKDWCENHDGIRLDYIGHITSTGDAIGEPRPDFLKPTILENKIIKWDRFEESDIEKLKTLNVAQLSTGNEPSLISSGDSFGQGYNPPTHKTFTFIFGLGRNGSYLKIDQWADSKSWMMIDTTASPGVYWQIEQDDNFTSIFPNASIYTNNIEANGRDYLYYGDFFRCLFNYRTWRITSNVFSIFSTPVQMFTWDAGVYYSVTLDNTNALAIKKSGKLEGWAVPTPNDDGTFNIANSTVWFKFDKTNMLLKHHLFTKAQADNRAWSSWRNTADFKVSEYPISLNIDDDYYVHLYHNLPICISRNNIAITTPTTEMKNVFAAKGDILIANDYIFLFKEATFENINISKIADYKFKLNTLSRYNIFSEDRDGNIKTSMSFIPYFNEIKWNGYGSLALLQCPDGNEYNDVFSMGFGINATLDDNITETSALLPAIAIPFYCNSRNIDAFNKQVIDKNAPIFIPDTKHITDSEISLGVFYTHSLSSTEISYQYSEKNKKIFIDDKLQNTQWWIGADNMFLPLGLGSTFSGINYLASTVELPGNYSVRLYTQNNSSFLLYNIAQQSYYGQTIFTIYGSSYYYDSQGIYYIGDGSSNEFVCYAIGMKFLANSGTEAYFYSPVDKYLYSFTGSNTLTKTISFANVPNIKYAIFSSVEQSLYILFEDNTIYVQNGISSAYFTDLDTINELQGTTKGCAIIYEKSFEILNPHEGDIIPLYLETEYLGSDDVIIQCKYIDLLLLSNNKSQTIKVLVEMLGTDSINTSEKIINLKASDFKNEYLKVRVSPKVNNGQAFRLKIQSNDEVLLSSIAPNIEKVGAAGFNGLNY